MAVFRSAPPASAYLVCATQRSGSTLLCETLRATGVAGRPLEHFEVRRATGRPPQPREYFHDLDDTEVLALLPAEEAPEPSGEGPHAWWARVLEEGSSANGVWGGKLMWDQTEDLTTHFREILDRPDATLHTGIDELLGETPMVFVTRPDRVDQAVSLWKAVQTREWRHGDEAGGAEPQFSFAAIHHLAQRLEADDRSWRSWFAQEGIAPLTVEYDELSADPRARVGEVLAHLGLPDVDVPEPPTRRQGDETSRAWARRYREQAGARA